MGVIDHAVVVDERAVHGIQIDKVRPLLQNTESAPQTIFLA